MLARSSRGPDRGDRQFLALSRHHGAGVFIMLTVDQVVMKKAPCLGLIASILLPGPLFGGLYLYYLKLLRGRQALLGDAFSGFNSPHVSRLLLCGFGAGGYRHPSGGPLLAPAIAISQPHSRIFRKSCRLDSSCGAGFAVIPIFYVSMCWLFSYALIIDKRLSPGQPWN